MNTRIAGSRFSSRLVQNVAMIAIALSLCSCGGNDGKTYETFGTAEAAFRTAPSLIASQSGNVQLIATGSEWTINFDRGQTHFDPVTGRLIVAAGNGPASRTVIVGFLPGIPKKDGSGFTTPVTEWKPKTVWVFTDNKFISTQQITIQSNGAFATFDDPPIGKSDATHITVEYVSSAGSALVSSALIWM